MTSAQRTTTTVTIELEVSLDLTEDELFPDGRPSTLPPGPLNAQDVAEYLKGQLRSFSDVSDWGFFGAPTLYVRTAEGAHASTLLRELL